MSKTMHRCGTALCLGLFLCLTGCALFAPSGGPEVADNAEYARFIRLFPDLMQAQGLADRNLAYEDHGKPRGRFGPIMFRQLSPDFLFAEKGHDVYLGENFHATRTPSTSLIPDKDGEGFTLAHPSQRLSMRMLARLDWNRDGQMDWLMLCTVESYRGGRVRHYYLLAPEPEPRRQTHGTVLATVDDRGAAKPVLRVRDVSDYGRAEESLPPTEVDDALPGDRQITAPPSGKSRQGGVTERDI